MKRWIAVGVAVCALLALLMQPPPLARAEAWLHYRLTGYLPPPIVVGRNGRLFLGNHEGSVPRSLIAETCGTGVDATAVARSAAALRAVLVAGHRLAVPFRFLIVPTAPRIYPEDVPAGMPCDDWAADRVVHVLADPALVYPVAEMQALKARFDVLPRRHFHWAGEGPLRVAEGVAEGMGLTKAVNLTLRPDNRASDLNGFYPGLGLHDRIGTPDLRKAGVAQCWGARCSPAVPESVVVYSRPGPGRLLVIADSFGDEFAGNFSEYAGQVWLVRMNLAVAEPAGSVEAAMRTFDPQAIVVAYHDAGAMALDAASQASLARVAQLLADAGLPSRAAAP